MGVDDPQPLVSVEFEVHGNVQGVYFTKYCREMADELRIGGWVKNSKRGTILGKIQGTKDSMDIMLEWLSKKGSPGSQIERCDVTHKEQLAKLDYRNFSVRF